MTVDEPNDTDQPAAQPVESAPLAPPPAVAEEPAVPVAAAPMVAAPATSESTPTAPPPTTPVATAPSPVVTAPAPTVVPAKASGLVKVLAVIVMASGLIMMAAGVVTWFVVRDQLSQEDITVSADADHFGGEQVDSPWTAYAQAEAIHKHELEIGGGKTYAQLPQDDPARATVMTASFLRASLFTSVVSFGVAFFAAGVGLLMLIIGFVLLRLAKLIGATVPAPVAASS